jgi:capsular exopolysaccharide synthesis family protein
VIAQIAEVGGGSTAVAGGGSVLAAAEVPSVPVSPRPLRTGALALVLGLLLGVGLAFLRDHIDDVIRDEPDFKRATAGLPILGRIPNWQDPDGGERLATVLEPHSLASESYRELSAGVRFLLLAHTDRQGEVGPTDSVGRSIMLSSAHAGDGKTSTAANLAVAAARVGLRTLLIDGDLRRPTVHKRFGLGRTTGLTDLLLSGGDVDDHLTEVGVDNLQVLPAGTLPPNPHELLASPAMRALQRDVLLRADLVIYDTPAVLAVPDALELAQYVDVAVLVGRTGSTSRRQLSAAIERMEQVGGEVAGTVLNDIDPQTDGYYYSYYYLNDDAKSDSSGAKPNRRSAKGKAPRRRRSRRRMDAGRVATLPAALPRDRDPVATGAVTGSAISGAGADAGSAPAAASSPPDEAASTDVGEQHPRWVRVETAEARPATTDTTREPDQRATLVENASKSAVASEVAAPVEVTPSAALEPQPESVVEAAADVDVDPEPAVVATAHLDAEPGSAVEPRAAGELKPAANDAEQGEEASLVASSEPSTDVTDPASVPAEDEADQAASQDVPANGSAAEGQRNPRPRRRAGGSRGKDAETSSLRNGSTTKRRGNATEAHEESADQGLVSVRVSDVRDPGPGVEPEGDEDTLFGHHRD